ATLSEDDGAVVRRAHSLIGIPEGLDRLEPVTRRLGELCGELQSEGWSGAIDDIERFCGIAQSFLEGQSHDQLFSPTHTARKPFHGILASHPLYPIFFFNSEKPQMQPAYWRLLKLMLTSRLRETERHQRSRFEDLDGRELETLTIACRLVRKLHKDSEESVALLEHIDRYKHPQGLLGWINMGCPLNPPLGNATYNQVRRLGHYLADCYGMESVVEERVWKRGRTQPSSKRVKRDSDTVNLSLWDWRKHRTDAEPTRTIEKRDTGMELRRLAPEVPATARQDLGEAGLLAAEFHQDTEHWLGIVHSDEQLPEDEEETAGEGSPGPSGEIETGLPSYAKYFTAAKNKAMKFAFVNQRTATRWSRPTKAEYAELVGAVERRFVEACRIADDNDERPSKREEAARVRDLCLTMGLMMAFGRGFDTIHELYVLESLADWDGDSMEVAFLSQEQSWVVNTPRLGYRSDPHPDQQRWYQGVTHRVLLPDLLGLGRVVTQRATTLQTDQPLKGRKRQSQEKYFHHHFEKRRAPGGRFSWELDTIANLLGDWLEVNEPPTIAGLLVPRLGRYVATQLFYTVVEAEQLESAYIRAWEALSDDLHAEGVRPEQQSGDSLFALQLNGCDRPNPANKEVFVGAERVATSDYFRQLVGSLTDSIKAGAPSMSVAEQHNEYSAYTWLYLAMATASRGVHHPFENLDIAAELGELHVHDKDFESGGQARVAFLPEQLTDHLQHYLRWCQRVLQIIARAGPAPRIGFNRMQVKSRRQTLQPTSGEDTYPAFGSLFFLNDDWHPEPATPKTVKAHLGDRHPLPINAQRHVLRSYLIEQQCPEELIDSFMGHWDRGREPWASYSVVEPTQYRQQMLAYLEPFLSGLGFESLEPTDV
ncbi:MAG: hypothetical protein ACQEQ1_06615, partial [Pseudomonadota bacterium]